MPAARGRPLSATDRIPGGTGLGPHHRRHRHPDYQGQGIGGLLVKNALAYLQTHVQSGIRIACSLYANPGKKPFYATYGFQPLPNAQYGHGMLLELS